MPQGFLSQSNHRHLIQVLWVAGYVYVAEVWIKKEAGGGDGGNVILLIVGEWSRRRLQISSVIETDRNVRFGAAKLWHHLSFQPSTPSVGPGKANKGLLPCCFA